MPQACAKTSKFRINIKVQIICHFNLKNQFKGLTLAIEMKNYFKLDKSHKIVQMIYYCKLLFSIFISNKIWLDVQLSTSSFPFKNFPHSPPFFLYWEATTRISRNMYQFPRATIQYRCTNEAYSLEDHNNLHNLVLPAYSRERMQIQNQLLEEPIPWSCRWKFYGS